MQALADALKGLLFIACCMFVGLILAILVTAMVTTR